VIENVTAELLERATTVTEQLMDATVTEDASLLPLDLNSTNNIVAQVDRSPCEDIILA